MEEQRLLAEEEAAAEAAAAEKLEKTVSPLTFQVADPFAAAASGESFAAARDDPLSAPPAQEDEVDVAKAVATSDSYVMASPRGDSSGCYSPRTARSRRASLAAVSVGWFESEDDGEDDAPDALTPDDAPTPIDILSPKSSMAMLRQM